MEPKAYKNKENDLILNKGNGVEIVSPDTILKLTDDTEEFTSEKQFVEFFDIQQDKNSCVLRLICFQNYLRLGMSEASAKPMLYFPSC